MPEAKDNFFLKNQVVWTQSCVISKASYDFQLEVVIVDFRVTVHSHKDRIEARRNESQAKDILGGVRPLIRGISVLHGASVGAPFVGYRFCKGNT